MWRFSSICLMPACHVEWHAKALDCFTMEVSSFHTRSARDAKNGKKHTWPRACPFDGTGKRTHKNSWHCPQCTEQWSQTEADVQNYPAIFRVGECNHGAVSSGGLPSCKEPVGNMCLTLSFTHLDTGLFHWCSLLWPLVRGGTQVQIRLKLPGHMHGHLPSPTTETNAWLQEIAFAVFVLRKLCQMHIYNYFQRFTSVNGDGYFKLRSIQLMMFRRRKNPKDLQHEGSTS